MAEPKKSNPQTQPLWQITLNWAFNGFHCANVLHYLQYGDPAPVEPQTVLSGYVNGTIIPKMAALQSTSVQYRNYAIKKLFPLPALEPTFYSPDSSEGSVAGDPLPGNVALCFTKRTGFAGRQFRGRFYLGGFSEADFSGNTYQGISSHAVAFTQFLLAMKNDIAGIFKPVVTGRVIKSDGTVWYGAGQTDFQLRDIIVDSQRGRTRGVSA